jgi:hypothetical protein
MYFEYKVRRGRLDTEDLNILGSIGWELVSIVDEVPGYSHAQVFYFKREKRTQNT